MITIAILFILVTVIVVLISNKIEKASPIHFIAMGMTFMSFFIVVILAVYFLNINGFNFNPKPINL